MLWEEGVGWDGGGKNLGGLIPQPVNAIPSLIRYHENWAELSDTELVSQAMCVGVGKHSYFIRTLNLSAETKIETNTERKKT